LANTENTSIILYKIWKRILIYIDSLITFFLELAEKKKAEKCQEFMQHYIDSKKRVKGAKGIVVKQPEEKKPAERIRVPKISKSEIKSSRKSDSCTRSNVSNKITTKLVYSSARKSSAESSQSKPSKISSHNRSAKEKPGLFTTFKEKGSKHDKSPASGSKASTKVIEKKSVNNSEKDKMAISKDKKKIVKRPQQASGKGPMSFADILKLAQNKDKNTNNVVVSVSGAKKKDAKMPERPMTQEEKEREARKKTKEYQNWYKDWYNYGSSALGSENRDADSKADASKSKSFKKISSTKAAAPSKVEPKGNGAMLKKMLDKSKTNGSTVPPMPNSRPYVKSAPPGGGRPMPTQQTKEPRKYAETRENVLVCRPASSGAKGDSEEEPESNLSAWDRVYKRLNKNRPGKFIMLIPH
jgi:hypothetical protein